MPGSSKELEEIVFRYLNLSDSDISSQLASLLGRKLPEGGKRQAPFNEVETLVCYGLFFILDPHKFGGSNKDKLPQAVIKLATFFKRSPISVIFKMLNLDGSFANGAKAETHLAARLARDPHVYYALYYRIISAARNLDIDEEIFPDLLGEMGLGGEFLFLGQEELPFSTSELLRGEDETIETTAKTLELAEELTEKLLAQKVRLLQHRFALGVLENCQRQCVFCGFSMGRLTGSGMLRASHIKPWAASSSKERVDVRNGLAACPIHDAAFDRGFLTVNGGLSIHSSNIMQESLEGNEPARLYLADSLKDTLILPAGALKPKQEYLSYHQDHIFRGAITK